MCKVVYYTVDSIIVINISGFKVFIFFVVFLQRSVFRCIFCQITYGLFTCAIWHGFFNKRIIKSYVFM
jgi:hypothetical protein